jgi:hypothetical protein
MAPVEVTLGDERHLILLTHGAICLAEEKLGIKIMENEEFWAKFSSERVGTSALGSVATLLYAGLLHEGKAIDRDALLLGIHGDNIWQISEAVALAIQRHLLRVPSGVPTADGESAENPTPAAVTGS